MSYDICLTQSDGTSIYFDSPHQLVGGTYEMGGSREAWLNITYNYSKHFYRVMGEDGIRSLYGKVAKETVPLLQAAIDQLGDDVDENYWEPTEGNAKKALKDLLVLAEMAPDGIWSGD